MLEIHGVNCMSIIPQSSCYQNKERERGRGKKREGVINSRTVYEVSLWNGLQNIEMNLFINEPDCLQCLSNSLIGS